MDVKRLRSLPVIVILIAEVLTVCPFSLAKDCGPLSLPLNGSMTGNETTFPNEVSFSCDEGFVLHGSTFRRCEAEGSWSGNQTECEG